MTTSPAPTSSRPGVAGATIVAMAAAGLVARALLPALPPGTAPAMALAGAAGWIAARARVTPRGRRHPWWLLVAALVSLAASHLSRQPDTPVTAVTALAPADVLHQFGIGLLTLVALACARLRASTDRGADMDAMVVGGSAAVAVWALLVEPFVAVSGVRPAQVTLLGYPVIHLALVLAAARLLIGTRATGYAERALLGGLTATLATGPLLVLTVATNLPVPSILVQLGYVVAAVAMASAAADASAEALTRAAAPRRHGTRPRIVLLTLATLLLPAVVFRRATELTDLLVAGALAVLLVTTTVRLTSVLRQLEAAREREVADQRTRDQRRFEALVRHATDVLLVVARDGSVAYASPSAAELVGGDPTGWRARELLRLIHPDERSATVRALRERLTIAGDRAVRLHARLLDRSGQEKHVDVTAQDLLTDPAVQGVVLTLRETTERAALESELRRLAFHDPLTGLGNRELFHDRLTRAVARAARTGQRVAVLLCDLDDFKDVNDTLGHAAGDRLLEVLARRFESSIRATDTVARLGGDEFAVVCEDLGTAAEAVQAARRLLAATDEPVVFDGHELTVGLSIGIAIDTGERSGEELLRDADIALYEAKAEGKRRWLLHRATMTARAHVRQQLATDLARALQDDQLEVAYQPIVDLRTGDPVGLETLARWTHPERGAIGADEFIPIAEQTGLVVALGDHMLDRALADLRRWRELRPDVPLRLGVNTSARQLRDAGLVDRIVASLARHQVDPGDLVLELTESVMLDDVPQALEVLHRLRGHGVRFAIDDFGTGYSSLSYLWRLPVDIVKIDRSFVQALTHDPAARDLVQAIVDLSRSLRLDSVAEGVETAEQRGLLAAMGCGFAQGYLFSRPVPPAAVTEALVVHGALPGVPPPSPSRQAVSH